ncbi:MULTISPECIES: hypothetical protein [Leisingera]|uniref:hypothetical protein n=1 Tax=Leisingera TaxID=191028 RepID=UPI0004238828|nr:MULTISPECIES: hypothetical protein [Leisingera]
MTAVSEHRISRIFGSSLLLTTLAELVYLVVWGFWLFPDGSWMGKVVWTLTCAVAMGAAIGAGILLWAEPLRNSRSALWRAAAIVVIVGSYCAVMCSVLDARFNYFGGSGNRVLFLASGLLPPFLGGWLLGWWLYRWKAGNRTPTETE